MDVVIEWKEGVVVRITQERKGIQIVSVLMVDERDCDKKGNGRTEDAINYVDITGPVHVGDRVTLNTTAVRLGLGSGGKHFISCIKTRNNHAPGFDEESKGHIMKLRYTPLQMAVLSCEEEDSPFHHIFDSPKRTAMKRELNDIDDYERVWSEIGTILRQTPVLIFELHSMLPILVTCIIMNQGKQNLRIVYLMTDGAALPAVFSDHVAALKKLGWISHTITVGHAFGGDLESVNIYSGLWAAKKVYDADIIIAGMGPGVVGTGTSIGFSAMELGHIINAVNRMGGIPIMVPRISFADPRKRHTGVSHHTLHALHLSAFSPAIIPYPLHFSDIEQQVNRAKQWNHQHLWVGKEPPSPGQLEKWLKCYPLDIRTMGRSIHDDPVFFQSTSLSANLALFLFDHMPVRSKVFNGGSDDEAIKNLLTKWVASASPRS